jgi:hypothetical protein
MDFLREAEAQSIHACAATLGFATLDNGFRVTHLKPTERTHLCLLTMLVKQGAK